MSWGEVNRGNPTRKKNQQSVLDRPGQIANPALQHIPMDYNRGQFQQLPSSTSNILNKTHCFVFSLLLVTCGLVSAADRPNILLVSIDDLNDWTGCLGGHPQAKTPNIDRLAERGTLFANAHCQSPVCNPSRASLMTGRYPHTSGVYFLSPDLKQAPALKDVDTLPQVFAKNGYQTLAVGKLFHGGDK